MNIQFTKNHKFMRRGDQPYRLEKTVPGTTFDRPGALALIRGDEWVPATGKDAGEVGECELGHLGYWADLNENQQIDQGEVQAFDDKVGSTSYSEAGGYTTITTGMRRLESMNSFGFNFVEDLAVLRNGR